MLFATFVHGKMTMERAEKDKDNSEHLQSNH